MLVETKIDEGVGWLIFNRSERLNAFNIEFMSEIISKIEELNSNPEVKVIAITGKGKVFSAGIDLAEVAKSEHPQDRANVFKKLAEMVTKTINTDKPVIIAVNGHCYGGGAELLWAGDIVIAVEGIKIAWVEAKWGFVPPFLSTIGALVFGPQRSSYIAMTSGSMTSDEAYKYGFISKLVKTPDELEKAVYQVKNEIMKNSPDAIRSLKRINRALKLTTLTALGVEELVELSRGKVAWDATKKFVEKKEPKYEW